MPHRENEKVKKCYAVPRKEWALVAMVMSQLRNTIKARAYLG
jgi:hypothetical protein